jgi:hypothetical protein
LGEIEVVELMTLLHTRCSPAASYENIFHRYIAEVLYLPVAVADGTLVLNTELRSKLYVSNKASHFIHDLNTEGNCRHSEWRMQAVHSAVRFETPVDSETPVRFENPVSFETPVSVETQQQLLPRSARCADGCPSPGALVHAVDGEVSPERTQGEVVPRLWDREQLQPYQFES